MESKEYHELYLNTKFFDPDVLSGMLYQNGCLGIQELDDQEWIVYFPGEWTPEHFRILLGCLQQMNPDFRPEVVQLEKLPYQNWNAEWQKYFEPLEVLPGCWVRPPWQELPEGAGGTEIIIDPRMAFGTGRHESTRLMMQAMRTLTFTARRVLDLGTGSGILAIYARKLGADHVTGIDIETEAINNARHNAGLNHTAGLDFQVGDISNIAEKTFAVILANIQFEELANLALPLYQHLETGGYLVISGVLKADVARISCLYKHAAFLMEDQLNMNDWAAIIWTKP
jgi:ribosomal protein L11 methyltransferase